MGLYEKLVNGEEKLSLVLSLIHISIFLAFAVAGLVEWLFHPCNPMGFATMAALAPLLTFQEKRRKSK